jgi:hypothetical protein
MSITGGVRQKQGGNYPSFSQKKKISNMGNPKITFTLASSLNTIMGAAIPHMGKLNHR